MRNGPGERARPSRGNCPAARGDTWTAASWPKGYAPSWAWSRTVSRADQNGVFWNATAICGSAGGTACGRPSGGLDDAIARLLVQGRQDLRAAACGPPSVTSEASAAASAAACWSFSRMRASRSATSADTSGPCAGSRGRTRGPIS